MSAAPITTANVKQAVPFFGVTHMETSLRFYVDGLGFKMKNYWIPDRPSDHHEGLPDGRIRWCWLELGEAAIMLQEFWPGHKPTETLGTGPRSASSAKTRLHSTANSNRAESIREIALLWETACGSCR